MTPTPPAWRRGYATPADSIPPRPNGAAVAAALDALCGTLAAGIVAAKSPPPADPGGRRRADLDAHRRDLRPTTPRPHLTPPPAT